MNSEHRRQAESGSGSGCGSGGTRRSHRGRRRHRGSERRKEKVLHTRISEQLSDDIRRLADDLRVPVSNLVRNVLEEVFTTVENVSGDVGDFFEEVIDEAEAVRERINSRRSRSGTKSDGGSDESVEDELRQDEATESGSAPPELHSDVVGWQPIIVHRNTPCGDCGVQLSPGDQALLGIRESGRPGRPICNDCSPMHD